MVNPSDGKLLGRVTRRDVIATLSDEVLGQRHLRAKFQTKSGKDSGGESFFVELPQHTELGRVRVPPDWDGRALDSVDLLAEHALTLLFVARVTTEGGDERVAPSPQMVLESTQDLIVMGTPEAIAAFRAGDSGTDKS